MPKVDGFAVLDYLKENNLFNTIPTTVISGDSSSDAINKAFTYPIVDMLNKPFSEDKIKQAVLKTISFGS
jgi:CheY-like chemotaxis protein